MCADRRGAGGGPRRFCGATLLPVAEQDGKPLDQRLEEIGAQLAWVRDYL
jgi:hypothetical protein